MPNPVDAYLTLAPCPFCGNTDDLETFDYGAGESDPCIFCHNCGAAGPSTKRSPGESNMDVNLRIQDLWNKRTTNPAEQADTFKEHVPENER